MRTTTRETVRTLTDGTRLRFAREGDDVLALYDNPAPGSTRPGYVMVYALVGEHAEAATGYADDLHAYAYGTDPRLDEQVDRIVSILDGRGNLYA